MRGWGLTPACGLALALIASPAGAQEPPDTLQVPPDSLAQDSAVVADSLLADSLLADSAARRPVRLAGKHTPSGLGSISGYDISPMRG